jgi:hypothetical protein
MEYAPFELALDDRRNQYAYCIRQQRKPQHMECEPISAEVFGLESSIGGATKNKISGEESYADPEAPKYRLLHDGRPIPVRLLGADFYFSPAGSERVGRVSPPATLRSGAYTISRTFQYTEPVPVTVGVFEICGGGAAGDFVRLAKALFGLLMSTLHPCSALSTHHFPQAQMLTNLLNAV